MLADEGRHQTGQRSAGAEEPLPSPSECGTASIAHRDARPEAGQVRIPCIANPSAETDPARAAAPADNMDSAGRKPLPCHSGGMPGLGISGQAPSGTGAITALAWHPSLGGLLAAATEVGKLRWARFWGLGVRVWNSWQWSLGGGVRGSTLVHWLLRPCFKLCLVVHWVLEIQRTF
jgi:hypothetical protein